MENNTISTELLMRFSMGDTNEKETLQVLKALNNDPELRELYESVTSVNNYLAEMEESAEVLPMMRLAAIHQQGLCDILCEEEILRGHNIDFSEDDIPEDGFMRRERLSTMWDVFSNNTGSLSKGSTTPRFQTFHGLWPMDSTLSSL